MLTPEVTQEWFDEAVARGITSLTKISALNVKNCKAVFNTTIPKALRDEGWNAFLVIKNHRNRYKYFGMNVENKGGRLLITSNPDFIWTGYMLHDGTWYAVNAKDLVRGCIRDDRKIIVPEIEYNPAAEE